MYWSRYGTNFKSCTLNDNTETPKWARWHLKSPASPLFAQSFVQAADQRNHQSSASLAFVRGIHRWPVDYPHKGPVTRKMFPLDDIIMENTIKGQNDKQPIIRLWMLIDNMELMEPN